MCFTKTQTKIVHKDGISMQVIYNEHLHRSGPWNKLGIGLWNKTEYMWIYVLNLKYLRFISSRTFEQNKITKVYHLKKQKVAIKM